jgi:hypothetical protein
LGLPLPLSFFLSGCSSSEISWTSSSSLGNRNVSDASKE